MCTMLLVEYCSPAGCLGCAFLLITHGAGIVFLKCAMRLGVGCVPDAVGGISFGEVDEELSETEDVAETALAMSS